MRVQGYCLDCNKVKLVTVHGFTPGKVPTGRCDGCAQKIEDRRKEAGELTVFVPGPGCPTTILPGSAIVGRDTGEPRITVDFEGDKFGWGRTYAENLRNAADRHVTRYPTVARMSLPRSRLVAVGTYDYGEQIAHIDDMPTLQAWANHP